MILDYEAQELSCDGVDNDCDQRIDEDLTAPLADEQQGICAGSQQRCLGEIGWVNPSLNSLDHYEAEELTCDALDNDCDGVIDENLDAPPHSRSRGVCTGPITGMQPKRNMGRPIRSD